MEVHPTTLANRLLVAAARATGNDEGEIWDHDTYLSAGDIKSDNADTRRERARQIAAIKYLLDKKYLEHVSGAMYRLTYDGYLHADSYSKDNPSLTE